MNRATGFVTGRRSIVSVMAALGLMSWAALAGPAGAVSSAKFECIKRPTTTSEGTPNAAMLRTLGVLRSPATAVDILPSQTTFGIGEGAYVKYVRLARTVGGISYYLIPIAKGCASLGEEVVEESRGPGEFGGRSGETLAEIRQGQDLSTWVRNTNSTVWGVVPDKVEEVVLTYAAKARRPKRHRSVRVTAQVVNNVFVANLPFLSTHSLGGVVPLTIVWRSAKGSVIRRIHPKS